MGRFCFDPKPLLGLDFLGEEDMKVYSEGAILGLKNYPPSLIDSTKRYDDIWARFPIMVGFNLPTLNVLDFLSVEMEYWANKYANGYYYQVLENLPLMYTESDMDSSMAASIKWSVFAKKSLDNGFAFSFQCARDHMHILNLDGDLRKHSYADNLRKDNEWYYMFRIQYGF
jgi:hypothetical protein